MLRRSLPSLFSRRGGGGLFQPSAFLLGQIHVFKLADIGEAIDKAEILKWYVNVGDKVSEMDPLCDCKSDKAKTDITSPFDGTVRKLYYQVGDDAIVGKPLVDIELAEDSPDAAAPAAPSGGGSPSDAGRPAQFTVPISKPTDDLRSTSNGGKVFASPACRRIASENSINLADVRGTGKGGRVTKDDLLLFIEKGGEANIQRAPTPTGPPKVTVVQPPAVAVVPPKAGEIRREKISGTRAAMVKSMTKANQIPAFGACDEINIAHLVVARDELRRMLVRRDPAIKLSYMPFFLKAASQALNAFPVINAHTNEDCTELLYHSSHNIGFAMDTPDGLVVPNLKNVQDKTIYEIAKDMQQLMDRGNRGALTMADITGGTFTLSNIGSIGCTYAHPIIFPPQVAIGALGRAITVPRYGPAGDVQPATIVNVSWSADHRVIDGATMVRFGNMFKSLLESPVAMLLDMK